MARSKWLRMELVILWVAFSAAGGYLLAKYFEPYQPGHEKAFSRKSTLDALTSGGRP